MITGHDEGRERPQGRAHRHADHAALGAHPIAGTPYRPGERADKNKGASAKALRDLRLAIQRDPRPAEV